MKFIRFFMAPLAVATILAVSGCGDGSDAPTPSPPQSKSGGTETIKKAALEATERGFPRTSAIWPERQIPTCWSADTATFNKYAREREITRQAVASTWEANSLVRFVGWQQCTNTRNQGVSIAIQDVGPYARGLGTYIRNLVPGVVLNFEFTQWSRSCLTKKDYCIHAVAVHEFGHVLSFAHEQNRPDTPAGVCSADEQPIRSDGDVLFGAWDLASVMNYCNPRWNGDGNLSPTDIAMVKAYYGDPNDPPIDMTPIVGFLLSS